jgi:hypothetical protein
MVYSLPIRKGKHTLIIKFAEVDIYLISRCISIKKDKEFLMSRLVQKQYFKILTSLKEQAENTLLMNNTLSLTFKKTEFTLVDKEFRLPHKIIN